MDCFTSARNDERNERLLRLSTTLKARNDCGTHAMTRGDKTMEKRSFIYIMTNVNNTTLYVGVTNDIVRRVYEHRNKMIQGFTSKYNITKLVYYEVFNEISDAIVREKQLKGGSRKKKEELINKLNPNWEDLYEMICL